MTKMHIAAKAEPYQGPCQYKTLGLNAIRLISFSPKSTPQSIHLAIEHHEKYMGHEDLDTGTDSIDGADCEPTQRRSTVNYTALSYCWCDPNITKGITLNGTEIDVILNLWQALSVILQHHNISRYYWTDEVCIDQNNLQERNHQVYQMWRIYSGAERVFAWLGPFNHMKTKAYQAMQTALVNCRGVDRPGCVCPKPMPELINARGGIKALWNNSYFSGTWIISESLQARHVEVLCGSLLLESAAFEHANANLLQGFEYKFNGAAARLLFSRQRELRADHDHSKVHRVFRVSLSLLSQFCLYSQCSLPQDKIFAMLGHPKVRKVDPRQTLKPDYSLPLDELLLVVLEWSECLLVDKAFDARELEHFVATFCWLFGVALGIRTSLIRTPADFCHWVQSHHEWDFSKMPAWLIVGQGRKVLCTGVVLKCLVKDWSRWIA